MFIVDVKMLAREMLVESYERRARRVLEYTTVESRRSKCAPANVPSISDDAMEETNTPLYETQKGT